MLSPLQCTCGSWSKKSWAIVNSVPIVECTECGVKHVEIIDKDIYISLYSTGQYHADGSVDLPHDSGGDNHRQPHALRFESDMEVGRKRISKLNQYIDSDRRQFLIDVGCANGAFMAAAIDAGYTHTVGVDLSADAVQSLYLHDRVKVGNLQNLGFQRRSADIITFNDSFEHFVDPISALKAAAGILKYDGVLVVEIPDMGCKDAVEQGPKFRHVKPHEHLFYFTANQLRALLERNGFHVIGMDVPIPGKVTAYASPTITVQEVEVHGPPGVGDTLWTLQKLKGIREREAPCRLKYVICCDGDPKVAGRAKDFLLLCPYIDSIEVRPLPLPRDVGCEDPTHPIYELLPNDYLDPKAARDRSKQIFVSDDKLHGGLIEDWHPELPDDWDSVGEMYWHIPQGAWAQASARLGESFGQHVAVYMSSLVWNGVVSEPHWYPKDWAQLLIRLHKAELKPVILGAGSDADYAKNVAEEILKLGYEPSKVWLNTIGRTSLPLAMVYMSSACVTLGVANGLPMVPLYIPHGRSIIFWPTRGKCKTKSVFCEEFEYNWLAPEIRKSGRYKSLVVGELTVDKFWSAIVDMIGLDTILPKLDAANTGV